MCTIYTRVQICTRVQINLHHLEGRSKFAPGCKFLKHRSHGQKYTPSANLHPGCKFAPMNEALVSCRVLVSILIVITYHARDSREAKIASCATDRYERVVTYLRVFNRTAKTETPIVISLHSIEIIIFEV